MELVSKPKATADVWKHFGFKPNDRGEPQNINEAVCRICFKTVCAKRGNTTNMHLHLKQPPAAVFTAGKKDVYQRGRGTVNVFLTVHHHWDVYEANQI